MSHILGEIRPAQFPTRQILTHTENALRKSFRALPSENKISIFLFPTFSSFTKEKLNGVDGFTPYRDVFHLYLHPAPKDEEKLLKEIAYTTAHEYSHAVRFQCVPISYSYRLIDGLISEGLAEYFRKEVLGGAKSAFTKALGPLEAKQIFQQLKPLLWSKSSKLYNEVFYKDDKYPLWTGYSIGYQIVHSFRQKNPKRTWAAIIQMKAEDIFRKSGWM